MSIARKMKRSRQLKALKSLGIMHCGQLMTCKEYYDDVDDLWFCEKCGHMKYISHDYSQKAVSLLRGK